MTRLLFLCVLCLAWAMPASAAITYCSAHVQFASTDTNGGTTAAIDTTSCNFLVAHLSTNKLNVATISDSLGLTWTCKTKKDSTADVTSSQLCYAYNVTGNISHTFTASGSVIKVTLDVLGFAGMPTTDPFDQQNNNEASASATITAGSITPAGSDYLMIAGVSWSVAGTTTTVNSSYTIVDQADFTSNHFGGTIAYKIKTGSATAENPQFTTAMSNSVATHASFKNVVSTTARPQVIGGGVF